MTVLHTLDEVEIRALAVGSMDNNAYLLTDRREGAQLLVDAADEPERLLELLQEGSGSARLDAVVTTHRHQDHHRALASVVAVTGAPSMTGADDADAIQETTDIPVSRRLHHDDILTVGALTFDVVQLRGHTPGSVALAYREPAGRVHLFTGDSLFPGGPGATRTPEHFGSLMADLTERVFDRFDDDTVVYPGHGRSTTLGAERPHLDEWRARGW
ncbi:MBL fold metallo-hydrolase [Cellulomonas sp. URHD0024]|uniref:MBL fold metallo-hydrolase n=1 Tax=Cellulomonas sp. URHD0024 TaxID=1302620 RepID=UPI0004152FE9|nr:MBL fold metallo-hydrolase [Cellulomonas sp. URHD0024]